MYYDGTCPVCNSSANLSYVGNIQDSGTVNTQGGFVGFNMGEGGGIVPGLQFSTSMSNFTRRFQPPLRPGGMYIAGFWLWWFIWFPICTIVIRYMAIPPVPSDSDPIYWFLTTVLFITFGAPVGMLMALLTQIAIRIIRHRAYRNWLVSYNKLRRAMYCSHDDIIFDYDTLGRPDDFIRYVFFEMPVAKYALESKPAT